jgi:hypothetical protein
MTGAEFQRLQADVRAFGQCLGVAVTLRLVLRRSSHCSGSVGLILRVFRFIPEQLPTEYSPAMTYRPDLKNLNARICADIKVAAENLGAVRVSDLSAPPLADATPTSRTAPVTRLYASARAFVPPAVPSSGTQCAPT